MCTPPCKPTTISHVEHMSWTLNMIYYNRLVYDARRTREDWCPWPSNHATAYVYACNGQYGVGYVPAVLFNGVRYNSTTLERSYYSSHRPHTDMLVSQLDSTKYKNIMSQALTVIHANMHIKETCTIPLPERKGLYVYITGLPPRKIDLSVLNYTAICL